MENTRKGSSILSEMIDQGKVILVGAEYELETGKVTFFE